MWCIIKCEICKCKVMGSALSKTLTEYKSKVYINSLWIKAPAKCRNVLCKTLLWWSPACTIFHSSNCLGKLSTVCAEAAACSSFRELHEFISKYFIVKLNWTAASHAAHINEIQNASCASSNNCIYKSKSLISQNAKEENVI